MVRFSVADDFLNMLLAQTWIASGLKVDVAAMLKSSTDSSIPFELKAGSIATLLGASDLLDIVDGDADIGLTLETLAPPLVSIHSGDEPRVRIDVPEMKLTFSADIEGVSTVWAVVIVHLSLELTKR